MKIALPAALCCLLSLATFCSPETTPPPAAPEAAVEDSQPPENSEDESNLSRFVGTLHPPVPAGVETRGGALAMAPGESAAEAQFAFEDVRAGSARMLWLSKLQGRNAEGEASFRVVDLVKLPRLDPKEVLLIHGCESQDRTAIAAVVLQEEKEILTRVRQAWGVDRQSEQLVEISGSGVKCQREGLNAP